MKVNRPEASFKRIDRHYETVIVFVWTSSNHSVLRTPVHEGERTEPRQEQFMRLKTRLSAAAAVDGGDEKKRPSELTGGCTGSQVVVQ